MANPRARGQAPPSALSLLREGAVDLVINVAREYEAHGLPDGALIWRLAVDLEVPLITDLMLARAVVQAVVAPLARRARGAAVAFLSLKTAGAAQTASFRIFKYLSATLATSKLSARSSARFL